VAEPIKCAEFAMLAEGHRRAGMLDQAEQMVRSGLEAHPDCAEGALVLALVLIDQGRDEEARSGITRWAETHLGVEVTDHSTSGAAFDTGIELADHSASSEAFDMDAEMADDSTSGGAFDTGLELADHSASSDAFELGAEAADASTSGEAFAAEEFDMDVSEGEVESAFESAETDRNEVIDADAIAQHAMSEVDGDLADEFASPESSYATRTVANLLSQQGDEKRASRIRAMMESQASDTPAGPRDRKTRQIEQLERWLANIRGGMQ